MIIELRRGSQFCRTLHPGPRGPAPVPRRPGPVAPVASDVELLRKFGYDPADIEIVGPISQWRKEAPDGSFTVSYYFRHRPRTTHVDLPALYAAARRKPKTKLPTSTGRVTVVCLADVQAGKTGKRGGTPELIDRLVEKREKLAALLKTRKPESTVLLEVGDLFEGFESGGNPMFTNDLSLSQQMDLAGTVVFDFVSLVARHGSVQVAGVPSNHTAWRNGKQNLGNPQDDLGLFVHRQVEKLARASKLDASWVWPADYDESVVVDALGTRIGMVHGNQFGPGGAVNWWNQQQHGAPHHRQGSGSAGAFPGQPPWQGSFGQLAQPHGDCLRSAVCRGTWRGRRRPAW